MYIKHSFITWYRCRSDNLKEIILILYDVYVETFTLYDSSTCIQQN